MVLVCVCIEISVSFIYNNILFATHALSLRSLCVHYLLWSHNNYN